MVKPCISNSGGMDSILGGGTKAPHAAGHMPHLKIKSFIQHMQLKIIKKKNVTFCTVFQLIEILPKEMIQPEKKL